MITKSLNIRDENLIEESLIRLLSWIIRSDYMGYEPSDGNLSPLHTLTFENPFFERILQQVIWKIPFDIRKITRVPMHRSTKGMGYMAHAHLLLWKHTNYSYFKDKATECLEWLIENRSKGFEEYCWGDSFPFSSRGGRRPQFEPTTVWTSLIGHAFFEGYEVFADKRFKIVIDSINNWMKTLPLNVTNHGSCLPYTTHEKCTIHNSNMLCAGFMARYGKSFSDYNSLEIAKNAMFFSCFRQKTSGAWEYGEGKKWSWIDNFHTGYNLNSLFYYIEYSGDTTFEENLDKGYQYYINNFLENDGKPKYYNDKTYPIDIQSASQMIETLTLFSRRKSEALSLALKLAKWTVNNMQGIDGHFYYRDIGWRKIKTPMFHWGQATMFKALSMLRFALEKAN